VYNRLFSIRVQFYRLVPAGGNRITVNKYHNTHLTSKYIFISVTNFYKAPVQDTHKK